ncbi:MAG: MMPL family transporter [Gammaproteobacteria bacterium]|nr:MMPL family transporter [Gammaproteobacteria bacterium]MYC24615.1 MMPL family transporter [Gammaproteobacteria bacterium]
MKAVFNNFTDATLAHRWWFLGGVLLVVGALSLGVPRVGITSDHFVLFSDDNPQLQTFEQFEDTYVETNRVLIAVAPTEGTIYTREALAFIEYLTEEAWLVPHATRVDSLVNFDHSEAIDGDLFVAPLVESATELTDSEVERIQDIAQNSRELVDRLVSQDGSIAAVVINFVFPEQRDAAVLAVTDYLQTFVSAAQEEYDGFDLYMTGDVVLQRTFYDATQADMFTLIPIVFLVIVVLTFALLRSLFATLVVTLLVVCTINTTMGLAGWLSVVLNPVTAGIPVIVMTLAIADSIHIVTSTLANMRDGMEKRPAIKAAIHSNVFPVTVTSVTTALAFLTLNASDSPPFHILGNFVAFGVIMALLLSFTLLPALLAVLPLKALAKKEKTRAPFERLSNFVISRRYWLLGGGVVVILVTVSGVFRLEFTDNWTQYFDERYKFRTDSDYIAENLTGLESWEFSLDSGQDGGVTDTEFLVQVDAFSSWLREQSEVGYVQTFTDTMKRLNMNMNNDDESFYRLPDDSTLAAQYLLLYEFSLPFGRDLTDQIDIAKAATRVTATAKEGMTADELKAVAARAEEWLRANSPEIATETTGFTIVFAHLSERNIDSMLLATVIAMGMISVLLIILLKSLTIGFISLLPNYVPAVLTFGVWGHFVGTVGLAGSVMTAIAFGIIVDDTTHFLSKYQLARRRGETPQEAVRFTFDRVGRALWTTTIVLACGFIVFSLSGFAVTWMLGMMLTITVIFALIADFLFLPPLLIAIDRRKI